MATNTSGGTTSSFMNTPQAKDDLYNVYEDNIWTFDVMANDLGGNAKILWSIDDSNLDGTFGVPASGDGTYDLLKQDAALVPELSDLGARIWIDSGKIKYDASLFNYLGAGQSISDHFTYAIRMSNGTLSWATVTVTITGTNDGPDIRLVGIDSASAGIAESNSGLSANGTLTVFDPDTADSVNVSVSSVSVGGTGGTGGLTNAQLLGMLSLTGNNANAANGTQGSLGWWFNSGSQAFDYLAVGQTLVLTYTLIGTDGNGGSDTQPVTITITGTNDGPDIRLVGSDSASAGIAESNSGLSANGTLTVFDPDTADSVNVSVSSVSVGGTGGTGGLTNAQLLGMLSLTGNNANAANGTQGSLGWWFNSGSQAFDYLAVGQTLVLTYTLIGTDGNGGSDTQPVTITITGTNDGPTANADTASTDEDSSVLINVLANDTDPDTSDTLVVTAAAVTTGLGAATIESGQVRYDPGSAYNYLAVGESETVVITYSISDGNGGTSTSTATVTVTGTNDGPTANADTASTDEDSSVLINVLANDTDPDTSDTLVVTAAAVTTGLGAATIESGQVRYDPGSAYNYLAVGESETVVITYSISDGNGGTSTSTATVTVTGTNDGPTANADTASTDEDSSVLINVLANDTDPDTSDTLVVTAAAVTTGLGAATIESGQVRYDPGSAYNYLAVGESETVVITYSISDGNGGTSTSTATVTVTGTNDGPTANADTASTDEDSSVLINVLANDTDPDTSDTLVVTAAAVTTGLGAATIESGQVRYDPGSAYNYLAVGESETVVITYSISDGNGGTSTSTATVTVTGTNDGPTANADTASTDEDSSVLINVLANDTDPDTSDTLVVTAAAVTTGLGAATIESGQVRYDPGSAYNYLAVGESETVVITYSISDGNGGTSTSTATVTVTGTNDGPTANADTASTDEDSSVLINVLANDTDPDTSDTLVVTAAAVTTGLGAATIESGQVRYDPGSAYNYLAVGESETVVITYSISDGNGGTSTSTATVTVTGTNDGPTANADTASTDEDSSVLINVLANDTDPDTSDTLVVTAAAVTTGLGAATIESGQVRYDPGSAYNYLAVGESETVVITYSISDGNGGTSTSTATVTVTGTNDGPDIRAAAGDSASATLPETNAGLTASGTLTVTDADTTDTISTSIALTTVTGNAGSLTNPQLLAMLSVTPNSGLAANTGDANNLTWNFNSGGQAFNYLPAGQSLQLTYTLTVSDGNGGTDTQNVTVTIQGTNDAPVLTGDFAAPINEGGSYQLTLADLNFTDSDDSAADVTFTVSGLSNGTLFVNGVAQSTFTGRSWPPAW
ncbi:tandem-95 repeat protein [Sphingomonas sediminicola]|uniref:Tandem-95 repeat protein n=1 Tax=Sphingomonas sediminicola TaxID=386874 RepID=A0ABX6T6V6_9SPHN|nr:Ig-like domain-containing protein [Sphingomonas sediminicola]QNP45380.1 tandem-95 repeat protein [Sphingomonas sediminicola]